MVKWCGGRGRLQVEMGMTHAFPSYGFNYKKHHCSGQYFVCREAEPGGNLTLLQQRK